MKWNIAIATLIASFTLCSQSYGDLLDRMLGGSGCGCESSCCEATVDCCDAGPSCGCDAVGPSCGCDAVGPSCGCDTACDPCNSCCKKPLIVINMPKIRPLFKRCNTGCGCEASCGCDITPSCGCDTTPSCGCDTTPSCGCDPCNSCRPKLRLGLLDKIFASRGCGCNSGCEATCGVDPCGCDSGCGCASWGGGSDTAPTPEAEGDSVSLPPTPIVDPSAFVAPGSVYRVSNR